MKHHRYCQKGTILGPTPNQKRWGWEIAKRGITSPLGDSDAGCREEPLLQSNTVSLDKEKGDTGQLGIEKRIEHDRLEMQRHQHTEILKYILKEEEVFQEETRIPS